MTWDGEGTNLDSLRGDATVNLGVMDYQKMQMGPTSLKARLDGGVVDVERFAVGLARGTPTLAGEIDLLERCFDVRIGGGVGALQDLRERIVTPVTSGNVQLDATAKGCWSSASDVIAPRYRSIRSNKIIY